MYKGGRGRERGGEGEGDERKDEGRDRKCLLSFCYVHGSCKFHCDYAPSLAMRICVYGRIKIKLCYVYV